MAESSTANWCTAFESNPVARAGSPEKKIESVDAVGGDVVERSAARERRIPQPAPLLDGEPAMAIGLGQHRPADGAFGDQLARAQQLGVKPPVVGHAEEAPLARAATTIDSASA